MTDWEKLFNVEIRQWGMTLRFDNGNENTTILENRSVGEIVRYMKANVPKQNYKYMSIWCGDRELI